MKLKAFAVAAVIAAAVVDALFVLCFCKIAARTDESEKKDEDGDT